MYEGTRLTAFAEEVEFTFICLLALPFSDFLQLAGFIPRYSTTDVERTAM